ncbi:MAG: hypothetical protein LBR23_09760, partial [Spirochaetaceae bacterium]|nr:hypothetical protein [Spirochaetaceae bacterium]
MKKLSLILGATALVLAAMVTLGCENATEEKTKDVTYYPVQAGDWVIWDGGSTAYKAPANFTLPYTPVTVGVHTYEVISGLFAPDTDGVYDYSGKASGLAQGDVVQLRVLTPSTGSGAITTLYDTIGATANTGTVALDDDKLYKVVRVVKAAAVQAGVAGAITYAATKDASGTDVTFASGSVAKVTVFTTASGAAGGTLYDLIGSASAGQALQTSIGSSKAVIVEKVYPAAAVVAGTA